MLFLYQTFKILIQHLVSEAESPCSGHLAFGVNASLSLHVGLQSPCCPAQLSKPEDNIFIFPVNTMISTTRTTNASTAIIIVLIGIPCDFLFAESIPKP